MNGRKAVGTYKIQIHPSKDTFYLHKICILLVYWLSSKNLNYDNICSMIITSSKALPQKHSTYNTVQPCSCRILHDLRMDKNWRFFFPSYQRNKGQRESAAVAVFKGSFIGKLKPNTETEMCCWENFCLHFKCWLMGLGKTAPSPLSQCCHTLPQKPYPIVSLNLQTQGHNQGWGQPWGQKWSLLIWTITA